MLELASLPDSKIPCGQLSRHSISNSAEHLNASIQKPQKDLDGQMDNVWDLISKADIVKAEMRAVKYQLLCKTGAGKIVEQTHPVSRLHEQKYQKYGALVVYPITNVRVIEKHFKGNQKLHKDTHL